MKLIAEAGTPYYATATGYVCVTSADAAIIGVLFAGTGTGTLEIFSGVTATAASAIGGVIRAYVTATGATANAAVFMPFPAVFNDGFCVRVGPSADPRLTIFWSPVG